MHKNLEKNILKKFLKESLQLWKQAEFKFYNFVRGSETRAQAGPQLLSDEEATGETSTPDHSLDLCYSGHKL